MKRVRVSRKQQQFILGLLALVLLYLMTAADQRWSLWGGQTLGVFENSNTPSPVDVLSASPETLIEVTPAPLATEAGETGKTDNSDWEQAVVARVVDGDTIVLEDGRKVRYIGIDTPETKHPSKPVGCYGQEAAAFNKQLVDGQTVRLEKDISETDRYGRLLRYVYVGETMINETLVREGYARASTYPPDVKYQTLFQAAQTQARGAKRGLWGAGCENSDGQKNSD